MKNDFQQSQYLSSKELWFLFTQNAPAIIIGFSDPTLGRLNTEIKKMSQHAQESLIAKKIIEPEHSNGWKVREPIGAWIRNIASPMHTIFVARRDGDMPEVARSYHLMQNQIIGLFEQKMDTYAISPVENAEVIVNFLMEPLMAKIYIEHDESPAEMSSKDFERVRALIEKGRTTQAKKILGNSLLTEDRFERFSKSISDPVTRFSIVAFLNRHQMGTTQTKGFSVIAGEDDIWLFKPKSKDMLSIQIASVSKVGLEIGIQKLIPQAEVIS